MGFYTKRVVFKILGHPQVIRTYEGSNFVAGELQNRAGEAGVFYAQLQSKELLKWGWVN